MCLKREYAPVGKILWGMFHRISKIEELMNVGRIIIGGCCLSFDDATWACSKCHQQICQLSPDKELIEG